jgi:hypothetical protein
MVMSPFMVIKGFGRVKPYSKIELRKAVTAQHVALSQDPQNGVNMGMCN